MKNITPYPVGHVVNTSQAKVGSIACDWTSRYLSEYKVVKILQSSCIGDLKDNSFTLLFRRK
jgi:hypothetical protein